MARESQALEDALRYILTDKNLPSQYADFQALTRDLIRRLSPHAVLVSRAAYNEFTRPSSPGIQTLSAATARFKAHNDRIEHDMVERGSIPPPPNSRR